MCSIQLRLILGLVCVQAVLGTETTKSSSPEAKALKKTYSWYPGGGTEERGYPGSQALSRDSYVEAASDLGYAGDSSQHGGGQADYRPPHSQSGGGQSYGAPNQETSYGTSYGVQDDYDDGGDGGGLGGAIGLLGLLGLKGLKAFKFWKILPFLPLLIPFLLPILAIPIGILLIAALFIPIPLLVIPGRSFPTAARAATDLALSEDCIERITCETARIAKGYGFQAAWIQKFLDKSSTASTSKWIEKVSRGVRSTDCKQYACNPISSFKKSLKIRRPE